jgi:SAM-dependent methyltransferase
MSTDARLEALWPRIRSALPAPPATVVEIGCGSRGGFVPMLLRNGYQAVGIDPHAPEGPRFQRSQYEQADLALRVDAVIACTSLHHVGNPAEVLAKAAGSLASEGSAIVVEWDWESFDEPTAQWCFGRLGRDSDGWLRHHRERWTESGQAWGSYLRSWATHEGLHSGADLVRELDQHFERLSCARGAYFFPDLADTSEADELGAIASGDVRATRIDYLGKLP